MHTLRFTFYAKQSSRDATDLSMNSRVRHPAEGFRDPRRLRPPAFIRHDALPTPLLPRNTSPRRRELKYIVSSG